MQGWNNNGQLGRAASFASANNPGLLAGDSVSVFTDLAIGQYGAYGIKNDGKMWGVGSTPAMGTGAVVANITTLTKLWGPRTGYMYTAIYYGHGCVHVGLQWPRSKLVGDTDACSTVSLPAPSDAC